MGGFGAAELPRGFSSSRTGETCAMSRLRSAAGQRTASPQPAHESIAAAPLEQARPGRVAAVLEPAPGNASKRLGRRFADRSPILVWCLTTLAGYLILAALMIGLGFLLVDVLLPVHAIRDADESVNEWLASNRSPARDDASFLGSAIGDIPFIPGLVILTALGAAIMRRWRVVAFILAAIAVEVATYRVTSLVVHRQRPDVPRLDPDHLPVNQSYPSGHVAASVVVYVGLALLVSSRLRDGRAKVAFWTFAIALPLVVALSRMYRGMHHPIDATAGILMGLAAIAIALFATRAAVEVARLRSATGQGARE
jgi:membrane-associated phospholipid phosphatase